MRKLSLILFLTVGWTTQVFAQTVIPNDDGGLPFLLWAGGTTDANTHMRIGTDYGHWGDAALEIYQNYAGGAEQNPGKVVVNGQLGIGTDNPSASLHVKEDLAVGNTSTGGLPFKIWAGGTGSQTQMRIGTDINHQGDAVMELYQNYPGGTEQLPGKLIINGDVGISTTNPDAKLTVKGDIHTREVRVDLNGATGPDFVFEKDYDLRSLEETEAFIKNHKHLPEIPSAAEMEENGIELKEMNLKLLQKVEELTLHLIEQNEKVNMLLEKNQRLERQVNVLEKKIRKN